MLVNSCYVSGGMRVKKVSTSKSDFEDHSMALAMVPFDRSRDSSLSWVVNRACINTPVCQSAHEIRSA